MRHSGGRVAVFDRLPKMRYERKEGKRLMKMVGSVEVPQEAFVAALQVDE